MSSTRGNTADSSLMITNKESLRQAKWWVKQVKQECDPGVVIALVGNKLDLAESHRDVPTEEAAKYADNNGFLHIETTAKTNTNINELFKLVAQEVGPRAARSPRRRLDDGADGGKSGGCCKK